MPAPPRRCTEAMADDRTEQPTAKRRTDAKRRGQVARSRDLNDAFHLGAANGFL